MNGNKVIVRKGSNAYQTAREALNAFKIEEFNIGNKRILLKPNAGRMVGKNTGINTSPEVVGAVIDYFFENGYKNIIVAESPILGVKALESLEISGIAEEVRKRGIPLVDLDAVPPVTVEIPDGKVIKKLKVCKEITGDNFLVSIPVMKTHMHTQVSLGLKNMKGCLFGREKVLLHQLPNTDEVVRPAKPLDMAIADMSKIIMPDFTIIDGTISQEGMGPSAGDPKNAGLVIASRNCLAADTVAVKLMGFDPQNVHHLREAIKQLKVSRDEFDFDQFPILTEPADYMKWMDPFQGPPQKVSLEYANVSVEDKDSCSACLSTVLMFLKRYYADFADYLTPDNPLKIAIGKAIGGQTEKTLMIGNCTAKHRGEGIFIQGCPPVSSQIFHELERLYPELADKNVKINRNI